MKQYNFYSIFIASLLIVVVSCSDKFECDGVNLVNTGIEEVGKVQTPCDVISGFIFQTESCTQTRGGIHTKLNFEIEPIVESGDTLFYAVQFEEGWKIYSGAFSYPALLYMAEKGHWREIYANPTMGLAEFFRQDAMQIREHKKAESKFVHPSWTEMGVGEQNPVIVL